MIQNGVGAGMNLVDAVWEFEHSVECNAPRDFCWSYWTNIANWDDPPAKFHLEGPFEDGSRIKTELPGQNLVSEILDVRVGHAATIKLDLPSAVFFFYWGFEDLKGGRTLISQRLMLSGEGAAIFVDQAKMMGETAPEGVGKLVAAMERARLQIS
jgi:hypothetical protein